MIILDQPPQLVPPERPAIIRPTVDLTRYFPVELDRSARRAIVTDLLKHGVVDDRAAARAAVEAAIPFGMFTKAAIEVQYLTAQISANVATSFSFPGLNIGSGERYVIVVTGTSSAGTINAVTVDGRSASSLYYPSATNSNIPAWWATKLTASNGATGTITVTPSMNSTGCYVGLWEIKNWNGLISFSAINGSGAQVNPQIILTVPSRGFALVAGRNVQTSTFTWANATERFDIASGQGLMASGADYSNDGETVSHTITATANTSRLSGIAIV